MEVKEYNKKTINKKSHAEVEEMVKKMRKEHERLVKGMFEFTDAQGGWLDFSYRIFKDQPLMSIRLVHGEICELPMGIIRHLNNTYKKIRTLNTEVPLEKGGQRIPTFAKTSRVRFTPMDMLAA